MNECYECAFWDDDYDVCSCPPWDKLYACPKSCLIEVSKEHVESLEMLLKEKKNERIG